MFFFLFCFFFVIFCRITLIWFCIYISPANKDFMRKKIVFSSLLFIQWGKLMTHFFFILNHTSWFNVELDTCRIENVPSTNRKMNEGSHVFIAWIGWLKECLKEGDADGALSRIQFSNSIVVCLKLLVFYCWLSC